MTDSEIIAVVSAHKEGKKIQVCVINSGIDWKDCHTPLWNFGTTDYRVTPEPRKPREFWLYPVKYGMYYALDKYDDGYPGVPQIHVREVLE